MSSLLVVDDDPGILVVFRRAFQDGELSVNTAESGAEAMEAVTRHRPDVALLDIQLPDTSGLDLFRQIRQIDGQIPVIFLTASGTSDTAIKAMQLGAFDYLLKPPDLPVFRDLLKRALEMRRLMHTPVALDDGQPAAACADPLIGRCPAMREVYKAIGRVASQNVTVLIRGESGTGKELVARAIYQHSSRANCPFLAINCAAIPESLLESELFGHEKGAFTGADRQRIGKFEQCHGGTLFLDEIGDMPPLLQTKMLRLLQEQRFERVGGNATIHTDVRIIAATHQHLDELIAQQRFRADLYYRLNGFAIALPPLRQRGEDVPLLIEHSLRRFRNELARPVECIDEAALATLCRYPWPGNVRELQCALKQAMLQATGPVITTEDLPVAVREAAVRTAPTQAVVQADSDVANFVRQRLAAGTTDLYAESLVRMEAVLFREVLRHASGNQARAAKLLGISRNGLRKKITQYGITIGRIVEQGGGFGPDGS
jgi:two-component system nitrogen regulation response regulator GlnG